MEYLQLIYYINKNFRIVAELTRNIESIIDCYLKLCVRESLFWILDSRD